MIENNSLGHVHNTKRWTCNRLFLDIMKGSH